MDLGDVLLVLRHEPLRPEDDKDVFDDSWDIGEDAEKEQADAYDLDDRLGTADIIGRQVAGELVGWERRCQAIRQNAESGMVGLEISSPRFVGALVVSLTRS